MRSLLLLAVASVAACTDHLRVAQPLTQQRDLTAFEAVTAYPNARPEVALVTAAQFMASGRDYEGYLYFHALAARDPARPLLRSLDGLMQARVADDVALLSRVAWVEQAIGKLDDGARRAPLLGRYVRGLVFGVLPARFGKARAAITDLTFCLAQRDAFPFDPERSIFVALASAHRTLGATREAAEALRRAGYATPPPAAASAFGNLAVDARDGFRFSEPRLVREADGVYVAEGFDMASLAFLVDPAGVIAIDAGATERGAGAALAALRTITRAPIRYLVLTHAHWDHVGGIAAIREPGTIVIASRDFPRELARVRAFASPFHWFFGAGKPTPEVVPDRLIAGEELLALGARRVTLRPGPSGETQDALYLRDAASGLVFVGDAFMPYVGSPFTEEGSPDGYLAAIAFVRGLAPTRLIHGHPPLTRYFNLDALPGLERALEETYAHALVATQRAASLAALLHDDFLPAALRDAPAAVQPYLVMRDHFLEQIYRRHGGRWAAGGANMAQFTRAEWGAVYDLLSDHDPARIAHVVDDLVARGDAQIASEVAAAALARAPDDPTLRASLARALAQVRARAQLLSPFRFIVASERASTPLAPVVPDLRAPDAPPPGRAP